MHNILLGLILKSVLPKTFLTQAVKCAKAGVVLSLLHV